MHRRRCLLFVFLALSHAARAAAQTYAPTYVGDISGGYVAAGTRVEVLGWVWTGEGGTRLNVNQPSARPSMSVDTAAVPSEQLRRLQTDCAAPSQFAGGCTATLRGIVVTLGDRPGIVAHAIEVDARR